MTYSIHCFNLDEASMEKERQHMRAVHESTNQEEDGDENACPKYQEASQQAEEHKEGKGEQIRLSVDGREIKRKSTVSKSSIDALQMAFGEIEETDDQILNMISELEDTFYKTSKERIKRLYELKELEVRELFEGTNKSTRGLLRRYRKIECKDEALINQLQKMKFDLKEESESTNEKICFVSQASSLQETQEVIEEICFDGKCTPWEKLFGLIGIPVSHTVQNYTDPMNIGVNDHLLDVVSSPEAALNQKSLWSLSGTNESSRVNLNNLVRFAGFNSKVSAVIPIKSWNHPAVWKAYHKGPLAKVVMSAQFRGANAHFNQDQSAFTTATLLRTIMMWRIPNEAQASLMADLLETVQFNRHPEQIKKFIENPSEYIINNNMASALAPIALMLESKDILSFAGSMESSELWRAIISNSIYWKVRREVLHKNRSQILKSLLKNVHKRELDESIMKNYELDFSLSARLFAIANAFRLQPKAQASLFSMIDENQIMFKKMVTNMNFNTFVEVETVKALLCKKVSWKENYPDINFEEDAWSWMKTILEKQNTKFVKDADTENRV